MDMQLTNKNAISTKLSSERLTSKRSMEIVVPSLKVEADYKITGKDGERKGTIECKCFVKQFGQLLHMMFGGLHEYSITDTAGVTKKPSGFATDYYTLRCTANAADDSYGIIVGLDDTAVVITDYALKNQCANGLGENQFNYGGPVGFNTASDATSNSVVATRTFANNSGSSIVVKEIGLIVSNVTGKFLILRDIIADPGLTVVTTEVLTVNYKIKAIA